MYLPMGALSKIIIRIMARRSRFSLSNSSPMVGTWYVKPKVQQGGQSGHLPLGGTWCPRAASSITAGLLMMDDAAIVECGWWTVEVDP